MDTDLQLKEDFDGVNKTSGMNHQKALEIKFQSDLGRLSNTFTFFNEFILLRCTKRFEDVSLNRRLWILCWVCDMAQRDLVHQM